MMMKNVRKNSDSLMQIGQVARMLGLNVRTLRYYERIGLVKPAARSHSGYRLYSPADLDRLRFVLQAKRVGFTLEEIREVLRQSKDGAACDYVRQTLRRHIVALDAKIAELQNLRADLQNVHASWQRQGACDGAFCGLIECRSAVSPSSGEVKKMKKTKRQVEVFSASCPLCDPVVEMVQRLACDNCEVTIHDLRDATSAQRAQDAGVYQVPMVLVNGTPAECCQSGPVTEAGLQAAGIGAS